MKITLEEELINRCFTHTDRNNEKARFMTTADITIFLEEFSKKINSNNVGKALSKLKYEKVYGTINDKKTKGYYVITMKNKLL